MFNGKKIVEEIAFAIAIYISMVIGLAGAVINFNEWHILGRLNPIGFEDVSSVLVMMIPLAVAISIVLGLVEALFYQIKSLIR